jgi:hypothetical protein
MKDLDISTRIRHPALRGRGSRGGQLPDRLRHAIQPDQGRTRMVAIDPAWATLSRSSHRQPELHERSG